MRKKRKDVKPAVRHEQIHTKQPDNMDKFNIAMVVAFFLSTFYIFESFKQLEISLFQLFQLYCLFMGLSFLVSIKFYRRAFTMSYYEYIIFNILAFTPITISAIFFLNNTMKGDMYLETYKVVRHEQDEFKTVYFLENDAYKEKEYLRSFTQYDEVEVMGSDELSFYFSDGLLGIRVIEKKVLH